MKREELEAIKARCEAAFIHAREDIPRLLAEVERLQKLVEELKQDRHGFKEVGAELLNEQEAHFEALLRRVLSVSSLSGAFSQCHPDNITAWKDLWKDLLMDIRGALGK
jgi:hypothetical protein